MIEISRTQDEEVGDGTTSVIILGEGHLCSHCVSVSLYVFNHVKNIEIIRFYFYLNNYFSNLVILKQFIIDNHNYYINHVENSEHKLLIF